MAVDELDIIDVFRDFGSPALVPRHATPKSLVEKVLAAAGLPASANMAMFYSGSLAKRTKRGTGVDGKPRRAGSDDWFALSDCGVVAPERSTAPTAAAFLPWSDIEWLSFNRDREGCLNISGRKIDTSPLSPLQTEILYQGIRYFVSRATGYGFSFGWRRCVRKEGEKPQSLLPVLSGGFQVERVFADSRDYIRFRAAQMGLGPELWTEKKPFRPPR